VDEVKANHDHSFIINVEKAEDKVATKLTRCGSNFIVQNREGVTKFMTLYDVSPSMKKRVCEARHLQSGVTRAVKVMAKVSPESALEFAREIEIMSAFAHPHIVRLFETFEDDDSVVLVMELCSGGDLMQKIFETTRFTESQVALLMLQLFRALKCMHTRGFCHRNLKPENLLFLSRRPIESNVLKVADFGTAHSCSHGCVQETKPRSPYYVAPQVLEGHYDLSADLWSCGVIMYLLLCGYPPFFGDSDETVLTKVRLGAFSFDVEDWRDKSKESMELIGLLLKMNPADRCDADAALGHAWIRRFAPPEVPLQPSMVESLRTYSTCSNLKRAALYFAGLQLDLRQIRELYDVFMTLDNGGGVVTFAAIEEGIQRAGLENINCADIMSLVSDGGEMDYAEFIAATLDKRFYTRDEVVLSVFQAFDRRGEGSISKTELVRVLGEENAEGTIAELGLHPDGRIVFDVFADVMRN